MHLKEVMIFMASTMKVSDIVEKLAEEAEKYKVDPTDENTLVNISFYSQLFIMHQATNGDYHKAEKIIKEMRKADVIQAAVSSDPDFN